MNFSFRRCWTLTKKECYRFLKVWLQTVLNPAVPAMLYLTVFSAAFGDRITPIAGISYASFLVPGLILLQATTATFQNASSSLIISKYSGTIDDLLTTPLTALEKTLGFLIGGIVRGMLVTIIILITAYLLLADLPVPEQPLLLMISLTAIFSVFSSFGTLAGLWAKTFDHVGGITTFVVMPMIFLGGVFHSINMLPTWAQIASQFNPFIYFADLIRWHFFGQGDLPFTLDMSITLGLFVIFFILNWLAFRKNWRLQQ
jgi:ABC-2 type transport system permease protein